jgi:hypothetical protein
MSQGFTKPLTIDTDSTFAANSDLLVPSQRAVKTAFDNWVGATSITTLGTITSGTWSAGIISPTYGGTGVNNSTRTLTVNTNSGTLDFTAASKTLGVSNTLTLAGTDGTTMTFPGTSATIARTDAANSFTGNQTLVNKITSYNGITLANNGVPSSVGTPVHLTAQTASIAATTCYTADADGFYQVCVTGAVTQAATTSSAISAQVRWTNQADNVVKTTVAVNNVNGTQANTTGSAFGFVTTVYAKTGTNIQYITTYSSTGGTSMQYSLDITVVKL